MLLGGGHFTPYDTYTYTHQGQFQYDDSNWVTRYEGLPNYRLFLVSKNGRIYTVCRRK